MAAPLKGDGAFSPREIAQMGAAYEKALRAAGRTDCALVGLPSRELRHRLASFIVSAARSGPIEAHVLAQTALEGLMCLTARSPLTACLGQQPSPGRPAGRTTSGSAPA